MAAGAGNDTLLIFSTGSMNRQRSVQMKSRVIPGVSLARPPTLLVYHLCEQCVVGVTLCPASKRLVMQLFLSLFM